MYQPPSKKPAILILLCLGIVMQPSQPMHLFLFFKKAFVVVIQALGLVYAIDFIDLEWRKILFSGQPEFFHRSLDGEGMLENSHARVYMCCVCG